MYKKKYDFLKEKKINYAELSNEIKVEISILGGLDIFTDAHVQGVVDITTKICEKMKMTYKELKKCVLCAYLHDVGKILIPSEVLQKQDKLTPEEYDIMKTHAALGYDICIKYHEFKELAPIIRAHHESLDGSGYPDGIKGDEIPFEAKLIKVADIYDALTRVRQYKKAYTPAEAISIMVQDAQNNKLSAEILYYLIQVVIEENYINIKKAEEIVESYEETLETLHELEGIYKNIYDRGQSPRLLKKLNKYKLAPGYDMSANANLVIMKQKVLEKETERFEKLLKENEELEKQYDIVNKVLKNIGLN